MNILMLYTHNPSSTSGNIPMDLLTQFKKKGHKVKLVVNSYDPNYPEDIISMETYSLVKKNILLKKIKRRWGLIKKGLGLGNTLKTDTKYHFFDLEEQKTYYRTKQILKKSNIKPDAIIVFFVKGFINSRNIYELNKYTNAPVYWVLYDMAPLTGGCHYAWECKGYQTSCGSCPGLFSSNPHDVTFRNLAYKKRYLDKTDLHIVIGSDWFSRQVKESVLTVNHQVHKIFAAFDRDIFSPQPKEMIREKFGLGKKKKIIFFGAFFLEDERKGMNYLIEALRILKNLLKEDQPLNDNVLLLIAGNGVDKIKACLPFDYHQLGFVDNNYGIACAYQAADIFVCPSIQDAGPTMINQSLMCGTPVVCFEMGVAADLVFNGKTGYRAQLKDCNDLANGMYVLLQTSTEEDQAISNNCRQLALDLYDPEVNIESWLQKLNNNK